MLNNYKQIFNFRNCYFIISILCICFASSCASHKRISYFKDIPDSLAMGSDTKDIYEYSDPRIQVNDVLEVTVETIDPQTTSAVGVQNSTTTFQTQGSA